MGYVVTDHVAPEPIENYVVVYDKGVVDIQDDDYS